MWWLTGRFNSLKFLCEDEVLCFSAVTFFYRLSLETVGGQLVENLVSSWPSERPSSLVMSENERTTFTWHFIHCTVSGIEPSALQTAPLSWAAAITEIKFELKVSCIKLFTVKSKSGGKAVIFVTCRGQAWLRNKHQSWEPHSAATLLSTPS